MSFCQQETIWFRSLQRLFGLYRCTAHACVCLCAGFVPFPPPLRAHAKISSLHSQVPWLEFRKSLAQRFA